MVQMNLFSGIPGKLLQLAFARLFMDDDCTSLWRVLTHYTGSVRCTGVRCTQEKLLDSPSLRLKFAKISLF